MANAVVPACKSMFSYLAGNMRELDRNEVWSAGHQTPMQAIHLSWMMSSLCNIIICNDKPIAIYGVAGTDAEGVGAAWLLGTDEIALNAPYFLRITKPCIAQMLDIAPTLANFVHVDNTQSIRWLRYGGFTIADKPITYGKEHELFYPFWQIKEA